MSVLQLLAILSRKYSKGTKMRIYMSLSIYFLSLGISAGLECKLALSEKHCAHLHKRYGDLRRVYQTAENRKDISRDSYKSLHREIVRLASLIGQEIPVNIDKETDAFSKAYSIKKPQDEVENEKAYAKLTESKQEEDGSPEKISDSSLYKQSKTPAGDMNEKGYSNVDGLAMYSQEGDGKTCNEMTSKERCDELLRQYAILKELYGNETTKEMLSLDAYNDLHRNLTEAGVSVEKKALQKEGQYSGKTCDDSVSKEECDALLNKYKLMKEMYDDADMKKMLEPEAYNDLHREMVDAGITMTDKTHTHDEYTEMTCDNSIPKETCDELLKKYKVMKKMYSDPDLKDMLNPDAYNDLSREMKAAGIITEINMHDQNEYTEMQCDASTPKETCDELLKKYKVMKEMYSDPDLKDMLNPDAYNDLSREMKAAGIITEINMHDQDGYTEMTCDNSIPKKTCDELMKKYKAMKEMYSDPDLKDMLSPDAYKDLSREMKAAGIITEKEMHDQEEYIDMTCDASIPKETCVELLKRYKVMKEMYSDPNLKDMLNPDAYNELHREMKDAGIVTEKKMHDGEYTDMKCDESIPKKTCDELLKKYKVMKEMYIDPNLKEMLNPDAYNDLHREMEAAGIVIKEKPKEEEQHIKGTCDESIPKETCQGLMRKYKIMKEMYNDVDMKEMLDPNAYNELHREMTEAGIEVKEAKGKEYASQQSNNHHVTIRRCVKDGLYRYNEYSFIFCSDGFGFVQKCPAGTTHGSRQTNAAYGAQNLCTIRYLVTDTAERMENQNLT